MGLYAIVDLPHPHGLSAAALTRAMLGEKLDGDGLGASVIQLRAKPANTTERIEVLREMAPLCRQAGVPLIVNDDFDAATQGLADGLHIGQSDAGADDILGLRARASMAGKVDLTVGLSTHTLQQVRDGGRQRPDYLALGPIHPTGSKANPDPVVGEPVLVEACRQAPCPLVAIGGFDRDRGVRAIELGATHVAMIGELVAETEEQTRVLATEASRAFAQAAEPLNVDEVHRRVPVFETSQLEDIARYSDDIGLHVEMGLPARFRPVSDGDAIRYRPCDVLDLLFALGKEDAETWEQWAKRIDDDPNAVPLVRLRRR